MSPLLALPTSTASSRPSSPAGTGPAYPPPSGGRGPRPSGSASSRPGRYRHGQPQSQQRPSQRQRPPQRQQPQEQYQQQPPQQRQLRRPPSAGSSTGRGGSGMSGAGSSGRGGGSASSSQRRQQQGPGGVEHGDRSARRLPFGDGTFAVGLDSKTDDGDASNEDRYSGLRRRKGGKEDGFDTEGNPTQEQTFQLMDDTYTLLFTSKVKSAAFIFAFLVFAFQAAILWLILLGMTGDRRPDNYLNLPPGISHFVRISQFFALVLAPITQSDFISALDTILIRYDKAILKDFPDATHFKWVVSSALRGLQGFFYLIVLFVLTMMASDTLSVFLNFAALEFISEIDNISFKLAEAGYMGLPFENVIKRHRNLRECEHTDKRCKVPTKLLRILVLLLTWVGLLTGGIVLGFKQKNGDYTCSSVKVLFGDEIFEKEVLFYAYFSGNYDFDRDFQWNGWHDQSDYVQRDRNHSVANPHSPARFSYCHQEQEWTFKIPHISKDVIVKDPCNWLMRSPKTDAFDLSQVSSSGWDIWTGVIQPISFFSIRCDDCSSDPKEYESNDADCNYHGKCNTATKRCECDKGWLGTSCLLEEPCDEIATEALNENQTHCWLSLLRHKQDESLVIMYERPVYYSQNSEIDCFGSADTSISGMGVLMYTGRRWFYTVWANMTVNGLLETFSEESLFQGLFHPYWNDLYENTTAYSEQTDKSSPVGLQFNQLISKAGDSGPYGYTEKLDYSLHCVNGTCELCDKSGTEECKDNVCSCKNGCDKNGHSYEHSGYFCQKKIKSDEPDPKCDLG